MIRKCDLSEATDGKIYGPEDMVRIGCEECSGCSACCHEMGDSIWLDPSDAARLTLHLNKSFDALLGEKIGLQVEDGIILPSLILKENTGCVFLDGEERCSIHEFRPGLCRLFPLGRIYTEDKVQYVLLKNVCRKENGRSKMKLKAWLGIKDLEEYQSFLLCWYRFLKDAQAKAMAADEATRKNICMEILNGLYRTPYQPELPLYPQIKERIWNINPEIRS